MKKLMLYLILIFSSLKMFAQQPTANRLSDLPVIYIAKELSLHFISPENILYADLSGLPLSGDMPVKNILRIKLSADSLGALSTDRQGLVTITTAHFFSQFRMVYSPDASLTALSSQLTITPEMMQPLTLEGNAFSQKDFKAHAYGMLKIRNKSKIRQVRGFDISLGLNHVYTAGDYIFLDLQVSNKGNLPFDIQDLRFRIKDKKIHKTTNVQSFELETAFQLYDIQRFDKRYRNIFAFKKLTFPGHKILEVELTEKQVSGRVLRLEIPYSEILRADTF